MKQILTLFMVFIAVGAVAQNDTIFKMNGEMLAVKVKEITESSVKFIYPGEDILNTLGKGTINKIHFGSGRKQTFASVTNVQAVKSCEDWQKVQLSKIESEVTGLNKVGNVGAKAKGLTTLSSIGKLQDRAYDKMKMQAAMLGANVIYIIDQNTEESIFGTEYSSSKLPSVTLSGVCYSSKKVFEREIKKGVYRVIKQYELGPNDSNIDEVELPVQFVDISDATMTNKQGVFKVKFRNGKTKKLNEFNVIFADEKELVLSGVYSTRNGKKTYYNIMLQRQDQ
ncbi:hypothetical protein DMA11_00615 [Marinilabiliaceae bacterium JC017]|nr:hypothetical protein DMA11_00615 [Marinilabiliaceae bacterium JC017]